MPDVNFWVALTHDTHPHRPAAVRWIDGRPTDRLFFCRTSQQGYLRLLTNRAVMGPDVLSMTAAWRQYDELMTDVRIGFLQEPPGLESHWRRLTAPLQFSPKVWNDAYLAAFAAAAGLTVVTFDNGFRQYSGVPLLVLKP